MDPKDLQIIKEMLLEKRKELIGQMNFIKETERDASTRESSGDNSGYAYHLADQGTDSMEREKNFLYAQRDGEALHSVDQALERIENGTYGMCETCQQPINTERLKYIPETRMCIACKAKEEEIIKTSLFSDDNTEREYS